MSFILKSSLQLKTTSVVSMILVKTYDLRIIRVKVKAKALEQKERTAEKGQIMDDLRPREEAVLKDKTWQVAKQKEGV
nr:hypothetical protein [Tanacetum cinerariifolium]